MIIEFGIPNTLVEKRVDNYEPFSPEQSTATRVINGLIQHVDEVNLVNGLWLWSKEFGTGKTHLMAALYNGLDIDPQRKLWIRPFGTYPSSEYPLGPNILHGTMSPHWKEARERVEQAEAIFIDELTLRKMNTVVGSLVSFFQQAYENRTRLFTTSNHPMDELTARLDEEGVVKLRGKESNEVVDSYNQTDQEITGRVGSRLVEIMTPWEVTGPNYREILAKKARGQIDAIYTQEQAIWAPQTS